MPSLRLYNFISAIEHPISRLLSSSAAAAPVASDLRHFWESRLTAVLSLLFLFVTGYFRIFDFLVSADIPSFALSELPYQASVL